MEAPSFASVKRIPTDESFAIMCQQNYQQLVANHLTNMLNKANYTDIRKWVIDTYYNIDGIRESPLTIATLHNNFPVCKVIIEFLQPKNILQKTLLKTASNYKLYDNYGYYHEIWAISDAFRIAVGKNLELAEYLYNNCAEDFYKLTDDFTYLELLCDSIENCYNFNMLDFLINKISLFLNTHDDSNFNEYFRHTMISILKTWAEYKNWDMISYVLEQNYNLNYEISAISLKYILDYSLKNKQFSIALKILNKLSTYASLYNKVKFDIHNVFNKYTNLDLAAMNLDAETMVWLLTIAKFSLAKNNNHPQSSLDFALLRSKYTTDYVLKFFGAKLYFPYSANRESLDNFNEIQYFLLRPISLGKQTAITLGVKHIKNAMSVAEVKQDIARVSPKLASRITKIVDVFSLNYFD